MAQSAAEPDPLRRGTGRAAAVGLSLVVTLPRGGKPALVLGRRRIDLAADPGLWHVVASGMLEPGLGDSVNFATAERELREKIGVALGEQELGQRMRTLGVIYDLLRLKPDLCARLDLEADELPADHVRPTPEEYTDYKLVDLAPTALAGFWQGHPPTLLTPAAAGAIALMEETSAP